MAHKIHKVFLDTSVVFAAVLSPGGGARKVFQLGEAKVLRLIIGPNVLRECEEVVRRKSPTSLPTLAQLLEIGRVEILPAPTKEQIEFARSVIEYETDAFVLAEAIGADPDWFVTQVSKHFLKGSKTSKLTFHVGTPGDLIHSITEDFIYP